MNKSFWELGVVRKLVPGSPHQPGHRIVVRGAADHTADARLIGRRGVVAHLDYCTGVGQRFPGDPFIAVRLGRRLEYFWADELRRLP